MVRNIGDRRADLTARRHYGSRGRQAGGGGGVSLRITMAGYSVGLVQNKAAYNRLVASKPEANEDSGARMF